jgi:hypothetical protein
VDELLQAISRVILDLELGGTPYLDADRGYRITRPK